MDAPLWNAGLDDEEDTDSKADESIMWGGKDGLIFLLDATEPMFEKNEDDSCPFQMCLECCRTTMLNKIISSEHDLIGIVMFGTSKTSNVINVPHVLTLQDLEEPSAKKIKDLDLVLQAGDLEDFRQKYGHNTGFALADALWVCQTMFAKIHVRLTSQRILLLTNTSNPHAGNPHAQNQARKKAEDLGKTGIDLDLLHIGDNFDTSVFFKDVLLLAKGKVDEDVDEWVVPDPANHFEELLTRVGRRSYKKRSVGKIYFTLLNDLRIGVGVYNLVRSAPFPKKQYLSRETNELVKSSTVNFRGDTAEVVLKTEIKKYQNFGGRKIMFTSEEVKSMSQVTDVGLKLLGFKPASELEIQHHCKPSSFIYPAEDLVKGSSLLFAELLERCLEKSVIALCVFTPRQHSAPRYVALLPQKEQLDDGKIQVAPPGFHVVYLPYADHIRSLSEEPLVSVTSLQEELAKRIIGRLTFDYCPYQIDNPKLQTLWRNIETLALDYDEPRVVTDCTAPSRSRMDEILGDLACQFVKECKLDEVPVKKPSKRANSCTSGDTQDPKVLKADVEELVRQGKVATLKVDELKSYLQSEGVKVTGLKKADLIKKVCSCFKA